MTRIVSYRLSSVVRVIQMLPLMQELQTNQKVEFCFIAGCACINDIRQFDATLVWNECNLKITIQDTMFRPSCQVLLSGVIYSCYKLFILIAPWLF